MRELQYIKLGVFIIYNALVITGTLFIHSIIYKCEKRP